MVNGRRTAVGVLDGDDFTYYVVTTNGIKPKTTQDKIKPKTIQEGARENRREKRVRTRLRDGLIADRRVTVDCQIRDRSRTGARLQMNSTEQLPRLFTLTDPASRSTFTATLVWQKGRDAGVRLRPLEKRRH